MKHVFLLIAALLLGCEANAENIGQSEALQKAKAFLQQRNKSVSQDNKTTRQTSDEQPYYAFNATDGGFVIVSGSDRTDAVIGYSDSGTAWECGYAYGTNTPVVVVHLGEDSNLMIHEGCHTNITLDDLKIYDFNKMPHKPYEGKMF